MRAAALHKVGEPPTLSTRPTRLAARGQALVRVSATPIVPLDLLCASGASYFGRPDLPYVPGVQGGGAVLHCRSLDAGTRVWFATPAGKTPGDGSLAELGAVAEEDLVPVADSVTDTVVASLGLSAVAAWSASDSWGAPLRQPASGEREVYPNWSCSEQKAPGCTLVV